VFILSSLGDRWGLAVFSLLPRTGAALGLRARPAKEVAGEIPRTGVVSRGGEVVCWVRVEGRRGAGRRGMSLSAWGRENVWPGLSSYSPELAPRPAPLLALGVAALDICGNLIFIPLFFLFLPPNNQMGQLMSQMLEDRGPASPLWGCCDSLCTSPWTGRRRVCAAEGSGAFRKSMPRCERRSR